jgi:hypothetical protein
MVKKRKFNPKETASMSSVADESEPIDRVDSIQTNVSKKRHRQIANTETDPQGSTESGVEMHPQLSDDGKPMLKVGLDTKIDSFLYLLLSEFLPCSIAILQEKSQKSLERPSSSLCESTAIRYQRRSGKSRMRL